jgi:myo-inositol-1(or 4)-monophosphatase
VLKLPLEDLLPVATKAVDLARTILHDARGFGRLTPKGERDYASDLDFQIERQLRDHLRQATPHIGFFGEEEGAVGDDGELRWVLDPIDGTVNFVHGLPLYAISLALRSGQQPVLGVIDLPALNTRFHAAVGTGAFCGAQRLAVPPPPADLAAAIVAIGDYAVGERAETKNRIRLGVTTRLAARVLRVRMLGAAAIDLAWLAQGLIDASVTISNNPWDMSAGVVLARETGHHVVDTSGNDYSLQSNATIAAHPDILPALLANLDLSDMR